VLNDTHKARLADAFTQLFGQAITLTIQPTEVTSETPAAYKARIDAARQAQAMATIENDPLVKILIRDFKAEIQPDSIVPIESPKEK